MNNLLFLSGKPAKISHPSRFVIKMSDHPEGSVSRGLNILFFCGAKSR
jgi:hypothetical protein